MASSGTSTWTLDNSSVLLEAFDRCEMRPASLTGEHMVSARRSLNLELQKYSNMGINLWEVDLQTIPLIQGVSVYNVPSDSVTMLDTYIRTTQLPSIFNATPNFSTQASSPIITVALTNHGLLAGYWINLTTQIAIGGLVLYGFYQVTQAVNNNVFSITAAVNASATVANAGTLPNLSATGGSSAINVNLPGHGLVTGAQFPVAAPTVVGGITLTGSFTVLAVTDADNFTISAPQDALSTGTSLENGGAAQFQAQNSTVQPIDLILTPIGRTDYAMLPNKEQQARPTVYWYDRNISQTVTIWQPPDQNGPYALYYYRMKRIQDANAVMGQTPDVPYLFMDALCAGVAARLATKYAKTMLQVLQPQAQEALQLAMEENRERADIYIEPQLSQYWNM